MSDTQATEAQKLDGSPIETVFNGKTYVWRQRARREQRQVRADMAKVAALVAQFQDLDQYQRIPVAIETSNTILDFCEQHNTDFASDVDSIDAYLFKNGAQGTNELLSDVFMPLYHAWLEPWIEGHTSPEKRTKKKG